MHYLALLALSEIASVRLCGLLFWYTGGFPARTTCPPVKVTIIKGIFDYFHLDWKTHNKFQAPAAEIPVEDPQVVTEDNVNDDVFLYQAAVENRDDLHASEEDLALVGQDVEDGQELPNSQQQEEELPELSASTVVQTGGQGVEEWRPAVV